MYICMLGEIISCFVKTPVYRCLTDETPVRNIDTLLKLTENNPLNY